jgi:hypothetical protein
MIQGFTAMADYVTHVTYKPLIADMIGDGRGWSYDVTDAEGAPVCGSQGFASEHLARRDMAGVIQRLENGLAPRKRILTLKSKHMRNWLLWRLDPSETVRELAWMKLGPAVTNALLPNAHRPKGTGGRDCELDHAEVVRAYKQHLATGMNQTEATQEIDDWYGLSGKSLKKKREKLNRWAQGRFPPKDA